MRFETIRLSFDDGILTLILDRPEVMNALNRQMRTELAQALRRLPEGARCVVITGSGRGFCAGQDLTEAGAGIDVEATLRDEYEPMLAAMRSCPAPIIAAVNGVAAGAGANLALLADVVIAAESASFVQAFTRIGLVPDAGGTWAIPRAVGAARAIGMMMFADAVPARQAAEWGLIWEALPDATFAEGVASRARHLAQGPTGAYRAIREAVAAAFDSDLSQQLTLEARLQGEAGRSYDFQEGIAAFLERRRPRFTGA